METNNHNQKDLELIGSLSGDLYISGNFKCSKKARPHFGNGMMINYKLIPGSFSEMDWINSENWESFNLMSLKKNIPIKMNY